MSPEEITQRQRWLPRHLMVASPRTRLQYLCVARWWELEARRGYASSADSLRYAANLRWAAELARDHGPGTWSELIARAGVENPEAHRAAKGAR